MGTNFFFSKNKRTLFIKESEMSKKSDSITLHFKKSYWQKNH